MRGRAPLLLSLVLNAALLAALWIWFRREAAPHAPAATPNLPGITNGLVRTNVVVRRQNYIWSEIESEDNQR